MHPSGLALTITLPPALKAFFASRLHGKTCSCAIVALKYIMPTLHRLPNMATIRVNVPDHLPPHVHVVMADRRDAFVNLATLAVISRELSASDIAECNP
jgi:hypothetical protein